MALDPLATTADLPASVDVSDTATVTRMLAAASAIVREAAGSPISETMSTINVGGNRSRWLTLPGAPVTAVASVSIDDEAVSDWRLIDGRLWRACGWDSCEPVIVTVVMTHGYAEVPADIVEMVASLAAAGINSAANGYGAKVGVQSEQESIDDYSHSTTYVTGDEATAGVMELPERTVQRLRARFGGGVYVTSEE